MPYRVKPLDVEKLHRKLADLLGDKFAGLVCSRERIEKIVLKEGEKLTDEEKASVEDKLKVEIEEIED